MSHFYLISVSLVILLATSGASANRELNCTNYVNKAVEQQKRNIQSQCYFSGLRWNNDKKGQYKWCLTMRKGITDNENKIREKRLSSCLKKKKARTKPNNRPNIPNQCVDPTGVYRPILYIKSKINYNEELYPFKPIQEHGYIRYDFNQDGRVDYIFIERNQKNSIKLATCFSHKQGRYVYKRKQTRVHLSEGQKTDFQANSKMISLKNNKLVIADNSHEHNWGSDRSITSYVYNKNKGDFMLVDLYTDHYSADGMMPNDEASFDFIRLRFSSKIDCSGVMSEMIEDGGCRSSQYHGRIVLKKSLPGLYLKPASRYGLGFKVQLIPDNKKIKPYYKRF